MDSKERSILQQKAHGTYDRNQRIRWLHKNGLNMAEIGRAYNITRQRVLRIDKESSKEKD